VTNTSVGEWTLSDTLTHYIMTTLFAQQRLDSSVLVRGRLPNEIIYAWLYTAGTYHQISLKDYDKFRKASKARGGGYSMELCEFVVEEVLANNDVVLNYWRRTRDDTGEGGRVILTCEDNEWRQKQYLGTWENYG
jgi:hypothetical protein